MYAGEGDLVFKPRNQWHAFCNAGDGLCRVLEIISPGGFEHLFRELADDPEAMAGEGAGALDARYGLEVHYESIPRLCEEYAASPSRSKSVDYRRHTTASRGDPLPFYQFTVPSDSPSAGLKADIAAAVTEVHTSVTGAPASYVNVSFTEVPPGSIFVAGEEAVHGRLVGITRAGRSPEVKHELISGLATAWSEVTGEPKEGFALFIQEIPGSDMMENGGILPEASED